MNHEHEHQKQAGAAPTWALISTYFTPDDISCMSDFGINLADCADVLKNADPNHKMPGKGGIYPRVKSGNMPMGGTKWTAEMCANFLAWSTSANPCG